MMCCEGVGFMAVVALSGSILYVALKAHHQLVSDFKKRIEHELSLRDSSGNGEQVTKKKVTFADDVVEPCPDNKAPRKRWSRVARLRGGAAVMDEEESDVRSAKISADMPLNRMALYRGKWEDRAMRGMIY